MKIQKMKITLAVIALCFIKCITYGQSFEGWITYKHETLNPNKKMIPDSTWQKKIKEEYGNRGYMLQKYFYKQGNYMSEFEAGKEKSYQAFNPKNKLIYSWQANSDTAVTSNSRKSFDEFVEFKESKKIDTIMGIVCKSIILKSKMGKITLWYNPNYLKMDPTYYKGHKYGFWEEIVKKIGCIPLKMDMQVLMINMVQTAIEFKETNIDIKKFEIPKFKEVIENPIN
jgi:hypothetical protein